MPKTKARRSYNQASTNDHACLRRDDPTHLPLSPPRGHTATSEGRLAISQHRHRVPVGCMSGRETVSFNLIEACWGRKWDDAKYILGGTDYDVKYKNEEAFTALHWTANHGEITLTYALLLAGADPARRSA